MNLKKLLIYILEFLVIIFLYIHRHYFNFRDIDQIISLIQSFGYLSFLSYFIFAIVASLFFTPLALIRLTALVIFGPLIGSLLALGGILLGSFTCFFLARYFMYDYFMKRFSQHKFYLKINKAVKNKKGLVMLSTRLNPVFSNTLQNYLYGLTEISLKDYIIWSGLLYLPGTILLALYIKLTTIDNLFSKENIPVLSALVFFIVIITLFLFYLKRKSKEVINEN